MISLALQEVTDSDKVGAGAGVLAIFIGIGVILWIFGGRRR